MQKQSRHPLGQAECRCGQPLLQKLLLDRDFEAAEALCQQHVSASTNGHSLTVRPAPNNGTTGGVWGHRADGETAVPLTHLFSRDLTRPQEKKQQMWCPLPVRLLGTSCLHQWWSDSESCSWTAPTRREDRWGRWKGEKGTENTLEAVKKEQFCEHE